MRVSASFQFGRSLYIDGGSAWCGGGGKCPTLCKKGGGIVRAEKCPGDYVRGGNILSFTRRMTRPKRALSQL